MTSITKMHGTMNIKCRWYSATFVQGAPVVLQRTKDGHNVETSLA